MTETTKGSSEVLC